MLSKEKLIGQYYVLEDLSCVSYTKVLYREWVCVSVCVLGDGLHGWVVGGGRGMMFLYYM